MHSFRSALMLAAALAGAATSALAGTVGAFEFSNAPGASTAVGAIAPNVTYARPAEALKTFAAFNVGSGAFLLRNGGANTINDATITFTASVTDTQETLKLFMPSEYLQGLPGCTYPSGAGNPLVITCYVRQFKAGSTFPPFTVFYEAPAQVTSIPPGVGDEAGTDKVKLDIRIVYAEGTSGGNPRQNSTYDVPPGETVTLGTEDPLEVRSAVPKSGGAFFTGNFAVTSSNDRFSTMVGVPDAVKISKASIVESECGDGINFFYKCWQSDLSIQDPATSETTNFAPNRLSLTLRQDALNIRPGIKIASVVIYYRPDGGVSYEPIGDCPSATVTVPNLPCIAARKYYKNQSTPGWTSALAGDFEWLLISDKNGSIRFPN